MPLRSLTTVAAILIVYETVQYEGLLCVYSIIINQSITWTFRWNRPTFWIQLFSLNWWSRPSPSWTNNIRLLIIIIDILVMKLCTPTNHPASNFDWSRTLLCSNDCIRNNPICPLSYNHLFWAMKSTWFSTPSHHQKHNVRGTRSNQADSYRRARPIRQCKAGNQI